MKPFSDDFVQFLAGPPEDVQPTTCAWLDSSILVNEMNLPPGPPGLRRILLFPVSEALKASILMSGMENVLSDDLWKWSTGTSRRAPVSQSAKQDVEMALLTFESMIVEIATCFPFQHWSGVDLVQNPLRAGIGRTATMQQRRRSEDGWYHATAALMTVVFHVSSYITDGRSPESSIGDEVEVVEQLLRHLCHACSMLLGCNALTMLRPHQTWK